MAPKPNISAKAKAKAEAVEAVEEKKKKEHRLTEAYLYREHPGHIIKERPVWVHEVREIIGERMDEYELEKEYLVIGDDMTEYEWVPSSKFFAPDKVVEFKRQMMEKDKQKTTRPTPLSYSDYMERSERLIPLQNIKPVTIKCAFSQTIEGKKETFFVVIDEQNKNVVISQDVVKKNFTKLYHKYLSTIYGFEVA